MSTKNHHRLCVLLHKRLKIWEEDESALNRFEFGDNKNRWRRRYNINVTRQSDWSPCCVINSNCCRCCKCVPLTWRQCCSVSSSFFDSLVMPIGQVVAVVVVEDKSDRPHNRRWLTSSSEQQLEKVKWIFEFLLATTHRSRFKIKLWLRQLNDGQGWLSLRVVRQWCHK